VQRLFFSSWFSSFVVSCCFDAANLDKKTETNDEKRKKQQKHIIFAV
jgi:hypothetical protein